MVMNSCEQRNSCQSSTVQTGVLHAARTTPMDPKPSDCKYASMFPHVRSGSSLQDLKSMEATEIPDDPSDYPKIVSLLS